MKKLEIIHDFLRRRYKGGAATFLIIDENRSLADDLLEEIRMLSNLQEGGQHLPNIILVGQPGLRMRVDSRKFLHLSQRISVRFHFTAETFASEKTVYSEVVK